MLRIGLTGELGSGKSTVARILASHGAIVLSSDEMARRMMYPGHPVYAAIVDHFGPSILLQDGQLDRPTLARLAFDPQHPRVEELNAIVHPAVLAEQEAQLASIARTDPDALVVIESALIFSTKYGGDQPWRNRFDRILVVTAPDEVKIARFAARLSGSGQLSVEERRSLVIDAEARLRAQRLPDPLPDCLVIENTGDLDTLQVQVATVWRQLTSVASSFSARANFRT